MSTNQSLLQVGGVEAIVLYKPVKNLHLNILPPTGRVRVTAPQNMNDDAIRTFLATRISWIKKMQSKFVRQERQTPREYASGESHYLFGSRYRLEIIEHDSRPKIEIKGKNKIVFYVKPETKTLKREKIMQEWYRDKLREYLDKTLPKWEKKIGTKAKFWGIRRMKTRWGTCNHKDKNVWFNLELAKIPEHCINYVIAHELIHLVEEKHSSRFTKLMDTYLPKWKNTKEELNQLILAHEDWK